MLYCYQGYISQPFVEFGQDDAEQNLKFCSRPQRKTLRNGGKYGG